MRAVTIHADHTLTVEDHPDPEPGAGECLVRVRAAGLNGADIHQRAGNYPAPPGAPQDIPGLELAGEVIECGQGSTRFKPGDRVMAIVAGGGQAELAVVHERVLMPIPGNLDWPQAGGTPEVFTTAHDALFTQAGLRAGERLLVHGAAGGVGTAAVQLGRAAGARVTATVRNPDARHKVASLGAEVIAPEGFAEHGPFDVILELVGAPNLHDNLMSLNIWGRIATIGIGGGAKAEINLGLLLGKRATIHGSTGRWSAPCSRCWNPGRSRCRSPRRSRSSALPTPTTGLRPAASSARSCSRCSLDGRHSSVNPASSAASPGSSSAA
jgi:NADPH:quinone reductase-like Zn-dependent oxidoreductase